MGVSQSIPQELSLVASTEKRETYFMFNEYDTECDRIFRGHPQTE